MDSFLMSWPKRRNWYHKNIEEGKNKQAVENLVWLETCITNSHLNLQTFINMVIEIRQFTQQTVQSKWWASHHHSRFRVDVGDTALAEHVKMQPKCDVHCQNHSEWDRVGYGLEWWADPLPVLNIRPKNVDISGSATDPTYNSRRP